MNAEQRSSGSPLLRLTEARVVRGGRPILDVPTLTIAAGELLGVVGPNGSGKSTLLRLMSLVMPPDTGTVELAGYPIDHGHHRSPDLLAARRRVTMVFQTPILLNQTVYANVAAGLRFRHLPEKIIRHRASFWLERLGIAGLAQRRPHGLSGGEVQRVALARALALEPDLLLLDEPTANLDWPTRTRLLGDLRAILGEIRAAAVLVTHEVHEAPHFADRLVVMRDGRIAQQGSPSEVIERPADLATARFMGYDNALPLAEVGREDLAEDGKPAHWMVCIRPDRVTASAPGGSADADRHGKGPDRHRGDNTRHAHNSVKRSTAVFGGPVTRLAPWGPLYRVTIPVPQAAGGELVGTCPAPDVIDGIIREGAEAILACSLDHAVLVPAQLPSPPDHIP